MGKLYQKFFLFFFLAQLTTTLGVGITIWWQHSQRNAMVNSANTVEQGPPARSQVETAAYVLRYGGPKAVADLFNDWGTEHHMPPRLVYVVNQKGVDVFNRPVAKSLIENAYQVVAKQPDDKSVSLVTLANKQSYLIFVPSHQSPFDAPPDFHHDREGPPPDNHPQHLFPYIPLLAGVLVSLLFAAVLAWYFSKPIKTLRAAFDEAANGRLDVRIGDAMSDRSDELSDLGRDFDLMATRIGSLLKGQTTLLHHVSHELRSPLARIQMALGLASQNPEKISTTLARVELEATRMDKMLGELLELSRLESGVVQIQKEPVIVKPLLDSIVLDAQLEADLRNIKLKLICEQEATINGQADLLYTAIENLVRNAIKYGPESSEVTISCRQCPESKQVLLSVTDQGQGVSESELQDIFKPFVRGTDTTQTIGHGVGLAITKQVVEAHGGNILARNLSPVGFSVDVTLPC
jgi:two-component system OmpR family sensor kinase